MGITARLRSGSSIELKIRDSLHRRMLAVLHLCPGACLPAGEINHQLRVMSLFSVGRASVA
jgi:hypothetical protein